MTNDKMELISNLFRKLCVICPAYQHAWSSSEMMDDAHTVWALILDEEGLLNTASLNIGIKRLIKLANRFPPSPGEFVNLCKPTPEELGCPKIDKAYLEASKHAHPHADKTWSHSAVKHAFDKIGRRAFELETPARMRDTFAKIYKESCELAVNDELPPLPQITNTTERHTEENSDASKAAGKAAIKEIFEMLSGKPSKHKMCVETLLRPIATHNRIRIDDIYRKFLSKDDINDIENGKVTFKELKTNIRQWVKDGTPDVVNVRI